MEEGIIIHKILDASYYDLLLEKSLADIYKSEYSVTTINDRYSILHISIDEFDMCDLGSYPYHIFPTIYTTNSLISNVTSGVTTVQDNPNLALYGGGVLIGFVDTGIDYQHKAFLNPDGSTRLYSLWDQTIEEGNPPTDFSLGTEYNKTMINLALMQENPRSFLPSTDDNGHGTMLAGIAAGSKNDLFDFSGVATESELVVVKLAPAKDYNKKIFDIPDHDLCFPETNILLGIEYIRKTAELLNRPLVLCIGFGTNQGSHSGLSALSMYLDNMSTVPQMAVCISAGNEGNSRRHYRGQINTLQNFTDFELKVGAQDQDFFMELWQKAPSRLSIELISPTGERIQNVSPKFNECREHSFVFNSTRIIINNFLFEEETGEQLILFRFQDAISGIWTIRVFDISGLTGEFDVWLPSGNLISSETYFMMPDPNITITSPGNTNSASTITAYNQIDNSILIDSSRGYTSNNVVKPDIAAPGYMLPCPIANNKYGTATGSGAAAAYAAGIVAMLMEWAVQKGHYTTITGRNVSRLLIRGARRELNVNYPNPVWGYGQIDILGIFRSFTIMP